MALPLSSHLGGIISDMEAAELVRVVRHCSDGSRELCPIIAANLRAHAVECSELNIWRTCSVTGGPRSVSIPLGGALEIYAEPGTPWRPI